MIFRSWAQLSVAVLVVVLMGCSGTDDETSTAGVVSSTAVTDPEEIRTETTDGKSPTVTEVIERAPVPPEPIEIVDEDIPTLAVSLSITNVLVRATEFDAGEVVTGQLDSEGSSRSYNTVDFDVAEVAYAGTVLSDTPELPLPELNKRFSAVLESNLNIPDSAASTEVWIGLALKRSGYLEGTELSYFVTFVAVENVSDSWSFELVDPPLDDQFAVSMANLVAVTGAGSPVEAFQIYREVLAQALQTDASDELRVLSSALNSDTPIST